ncbi:MAG: DUF3090 family protein [Acidimicrobiales bacterium]
MSDSFELSAPQRVTVGTVGEPGQRTFYLQAREDDRLVTLKIEKQQVAALAQLLVELLADLPAPGAPPASSELELEEPVLAAWIVGSMQLAYDGAADRVVLMAEEAEMVEPGEDPVEIPADGDPEGTGAIARLAFTREQAAALAERGAELVTSGRPTCPLCGNPMNPEGHSCPRTNGHRPPS